MSGNPKEEPLHYGEVFDIWSSDLVTKNAISVYRTMLNHAGDEELKGVLVEATEMGEQQSRQVEELLMENGVALAPSLPEPPEACLADIPVGARIPDPPHRRDYGRG